MLIFQLSPLSRFFPLTQGQYILHRHTQAGKVVGIRLQLCNANFSLYCNAFGFESTVAEHKGYTVSMCTATLLPCSQIYCYSVVP